MKSRTFLRTKCMADYIHHLMPESERVMKGTIHEDSWIVYHDALSLMTSNSTKEWMKKKGYHEQWILPTYIWSVWYLHPDNKRKYKHNPIGNLLEFMPLNAHFTRSSQKNFLKLVQISSLNPHRHVRQFFFRLFLTYSDGISVLKPIKWYATFAERVSRKKFGETTFIPPVIFSQEHRIRTYIRRSWFKENIFHYENDYIFV